MTERVGSLSIGVEADLSPLQKDMRQGGVIVQNAAAGMATSLGEVGKAAGAAGVAVSDAAIGMSRDAEKAKKALADAGLSMSQLQRKAQQLRDQITPLGPATRQYEQALKVANAQLAAGVINATEYARALEFAEARMDAARKGMNGVNNAAGAQRAGMQQLGMQLGDMATMYSLGAKPAQIFASQMGQVSQAIMLMGGEGNKFAKFLGGPWGIAISVGLTALIPFIGKLFETEDALTDVKFASSAVGDAQSILGNVLDMTTGKINSQVPALLALAQAQILVNRVQAQQRAAQARRDVQAIQNRPLEFQGGGLGGGFTVGRRRIDARDTISRQVLEGTLDGKTAVERLENLRKAGRLTEEQFFSAASAVANLGVELHNIDVFTEADKLLNGKGGKSLLKPEKPKKPDHSAENELKRLKAFGESAAESIARIGEQFADQPKLVTRVNLATMQLDATIKELGERKPPGFEKVISDAQRAKEVVSEALLRPFRDMDEATHRQIALNQLVLAGREDEAEALNRIYRLQDQVGVATEDQRKAILANVEAERKINEQLEQRQEMIAAYREAISGVRGDLEALLSGRIGAGDFLSNLKQSFRDLQGKVLTERLFGPALRELDDYVRQNTGIKTGVDIMREGTEQAGSAAGTMATSLENAATRVDKLFGGTAVGGQAAVAGGSSAFNQAFADLTGATGTNSSTSVDPATGEILVTAKKIERGVMVMRPDDFFAKMVSDLLGPALKGMNEIFGVKFFAQLQGALAGALQGYLTAGPVGAVLGGLKSIKGLPDGISKALGKALGGAQTGTQIAGIGNALGIKMSTTGAQIGGAIGAMIPIPGGDIIGAIAGGLIGKLFKKKPHGTAVLTSATDDAAIYGNKGSARDAAASLAGSVQQGLQNVASTLGADLGSFLVSVGTYKDKYRVNVNGGSRKLGGYSGSASQNEQRYGLYDFGSDQEAAIKFAIMDAIKDGAIKGIRESTIRLLEAGKDLDKALQDALDFESVFKELKSIKDPIGAAFDDLSSQLEKLLGLFKTAGASTEEYAQLQELFTLKQQDAIEQARQDAIDKISEKRNMEIEILELLGRKEDALAASRELELAGLKDNLKPLQQWIYQLQDARAVIDQFKPLADSLKAYRDELMGGANAANSFAFLRSQFQSTSALAAQGGAGALGDLRGAADAYLAAARENAASGLEFRQAFGEVLASVDQGIFAADTQVDYAQLQIDAINANAEILTSISDQLAVTQKQVVENTQRMLELWKRFEVDGLTVKSDADTPVYSVVQSSATAPVYTTVVP